MKGKGKTTTENKEASAETKAAADAPRDFKTLPTQGWLSHVLVAAGLLLLLFATVIISKYWVMSQAWKLTSAYSPVKTDADGKSIKDAEGNPQVKGISEFTCPAVSDAGKQAFIKNQKSDFALYAESHREAAINFYSYFYATYVVFSVFGLLSLISLAVIAKKGYVAANPHLITVFLVSSGIVLMYQGFFGVFQQKTNMDINAKLFSGYSKLATKIDTYCTTGKIPVIDPTNIFNEALMKPKPVNTTTNQTANSTANTTENKAENKTTKSNESSVSTKPNTFYITLEPDEFINYAGWQVEQLKAISIALDDSKIVIINDGKPLAF